MVLGLSYEKYNTFWIPIIIILIFFVCEVLPFFFVLDWTFMEMFVAK